jgi:hypothetical protein
MQTVNFLSPYIGNMWVFLHNWLSMPDGFLCDMEWTSPTNITETYQIWNPSGISDTELEDSGDTHLQEMAKPTLIDVTRRHIYFFHTYITNIYTK